MYITPYILAERFIGIKEVPGSLANNQIMAMLKLDGNWPEDDAVPWCSAFVNYIAWLLGLHRTKSLRARSWLQEKVYVPLNMAQVGFDIVILKRSGEDQPDESVIDAPGHVGFFAGFDYNKVKVLGGNQNDEVNISSYDRNRVLGVRRLMMGGL